MGLFDKLKNNNLAQKARSTHAQANELMQRGKPAEAKQKYDEAMELYARAYDAGVRSAEYMLPYAILKMRRSDFTGARALMKEISKDAAMSEDTHFDLRINYAVCLWRLGELDNAILTARFAGKHCKNSSYYSTLGTFLVEKAGKTGEFDEAKQFLDEATEYDDEDAATLDNWGEYYRLQAVKAAADGDEAAYRELHALSLQKFEAAFKQKPSQVTTCAALARYALEDGDKQKARTYIDKALLHSSSGICPVSVADLQALKAKTVE